MQCSNCGTEVREGVKFCESCGVKLEVPCPNCGSAGPPDRRFCGDCGTKITLEPPEPSPQPDKDSTVDGSPERRHLTVMFCDLVGSTDMARRFDAEDISDVLRMYNETAREVINRYGGYLARYLGDGILCYFGYPRAFEDSAERSVHAALDVIDAVSRLAPPIDVPLQTRVGIASGEVVTGETRSGDAGTETLAIGSTPNLAARLQSLAEPNTVYVADSTRKLVRMGVEWKDQGVHHLKGYVEPQLVWQAIGRIASTAHDVEASSKSLVDDIVGRDRELELLYERYQAASGGKVQIVQLVGEAGIGKSALVSAIRQRLQSESCFEAILQCSNLATDTPLFPIKQCLERMARIQPQHDSATRSKRFIELFEDSKAMDALSIACVAQLIGLDITGAVDHSHLTPRQQHARAVEALTGWIDELAARKTLLLIVEDVHWIDPSSLDWLHNLIDTRENGKMLILVTCRPEFRPPWDIRDNVDVINVRRLSNSTCTTIIKSITGDTELPEELLSTLLSKTEGIPLFVEELTKTLLDAVTNTEPGTNGSPTVASVPDSLRDSLMARLDRTPWIRDVVQVSAVIGREFSASLLYTVSSRDTNTIDRGLVQLEQVEVLRRRDTLPDITWIFKHALLRDAAYDSILRNRRRELHSLVADALSETAVIDNRPELLAVHLNAAGRTREAVEQWRRAAERACSTWANREAVRHLQQALDVLNTEPESEDRRKLELQLLLALGNAERAAYGTGASQASVTLQRAAALCRETDDVPTILAVREGVFVTHFGAARLAEALPHAEELLRIGEKHQDRACMIAAHQACGMQKFAVGEMEEAKHHLELALSHGVDWPPDYLDIQFPSSCLAYLSWTLHMLGDSERAVQVSDESIRESADGGAYSHALTLANACYLHQFRGDIKRVKELAKAATDFVADKDLTLWRDIAEFFMCWAVCTDDPNTENAERLCDALELWAEDEIETPYFKAIAGEACIHAGLVNRGVDLIQQAEDLMRHTGELWYYNELQNIKKRQNLESHAS